MAEETLKEVKFLCAHIILSNNSFLFYLLFPFLFSIILPLGEQSSCLQLQNYTMHTQLHCSYSLTSHTVLKTVIIHKLLASYVLNITEASPCSYIVL